MATKGPARNAANGRSASRAPRRGEARHFAPRPLQAWVEDGAAPPVGSEESVRLLHAKLQSEGALDEVMAPEAP